MLRRIAVSCVGLAFSIYGAVPAVAGEVHRTSVTLNLSGSLVAAGQVRSADGTHACEAEREVVIQKRASGTWRTIESDDSSPNGGYRVKLPNAAGSYRALVRKLELGPRRGDCARDVSPVDTHDAGDGGDDDDCTEGYSPCLVDHGGADYDCHGGSGDGPYYTAPGVEYRVTGSDPYGLDGDNDGVGCEQ